MKTKSLGIRISEETFEKLNQLVALENASNLNTGLRVTNNSMIDVSINYLHAQKMGKDVLSESVDQLRQIMSNTVDLTLKGYADQFAQALNVLLVNDEVIKKAVSIILLANDVLPNDHTAALNYLRKPNTVEQLLKETVGKD